MLRVTLHLLHRRKEGPEVLIWRLSIPISLSRVKHASRYLPLDTDAASKERRKQQEPPQVDLRQLVIRDVESIGSNLERRLLLPAFEPRKAKDLRICRNRKLSRLGEK